MSFINKLLWIITEILILLFLSTIPYYFDWIDEKNYALLKIMILLGTIFYHSFSLGKSSNEKSYLKGLCLGLLIILCFLIPTLILSKWQLKLLLYYPLILGTSTLSSMLGALKKKKNA